MSKIIALDLGDKWIGVAISDESLLFARPYKTVDLENLENFLNNIIKEENIKKIVIGYPKTLRGTESQQTKKILITKEKLEKIFNNIEFILWDERSSSKRAEILKPAKNKEDKLKSHSIAAAFILESYLSFLIFKNS